NVGRTGIDPPKLGGSLNLHMHLDVQTVLEGVPELQTDFILDWAFPNGLSPGTAMGSGWGAPTLRFDNVQMSLGSVLGDIVKPIANHIKEVMEPLEPVFNLLEKPIPGISDIAEEVG